MLLDTPICDFGWKAPDFTLPDVDGQPFSIEQHYGDNGLLVVFMCNHCPYVKAIIGRLVDDANDLMDVGVNVFAIMSNDYRVSPQDQPRKMKRFAKRHELPFPYLLDEDQLMARAYSAVCTPDFFGFNRAGELQYRGRLDDAGLEEPINRKTELLDAMRQVAKTGTCDAQQTPSIGCSIKWKDEEQPNDG